MHPDWAAFTLEEPLPDDRFIVGYGLDWTDELPRACPYLGTIPRPARRAERTVALS